MVTATDATPKSGTDTIKRAEMRVADSDTFKGRAMKLPESGVVCVVNLELMNFKAWQALRLLSAYFVDSDKCEKSSHNDCQSVVMRVDCQRKG